MRDPNNAGDSSEQELEQQTYELTQLQFVMRCTQSLEKTGLLSEDEVQHLTNLSTQVIHSSLNLLEQMQLINPKQLNGATGSRTYSEEDINNASIYFYLDAKIRNLPLFQGFGKMPENKDVRRGLTRRLVSDGIKLEELGEYNGPVLESLVLEEWKKMPDKVPLEFKIDQARKLVVAETPDIRQEDVRQMIQDITRQSRTNWINFSDLFETLGKDYKNSGKTYDEEIRFIGLRIALDIQLRTESTNNNIPLPKKDVINQYAVRLFTKGVVISQLMEHQSLNTEVIESLINPEH